MFLLTYTNSILLLQNLVYTCRTGISPLLPILHSPPFFLSILATYNIPPQVFDEVLQEIEEKIISITNNYALHNYNYNYFAFPWV